jgi:Fe2+ transport system protein B
MAIKLLEKDNDITEHIRKKKPEILEKVNQLAADLEEIHGHDSSVVIAAERSHLASHITRETVKITRNRKLSLNDRLDTLPPEVTGDSDYSYSGRYVFSVCSSGMAFGMA